MQTRFGLAKSRQTGGLGSKRPMTMGGGLAALSIWLAVAPVAAVAGTQEDQQACMNDALTICSQFIPDREHVAACLISNRSRISEACRLALTHFKQHIAPTPGKLTAIR